MKVLKYRKSIYELSLEIGDKTYHATIEDDSDKDNTSISIIALEDDFGNEIQSWSDEIEEEIMEAYLESF